MDKLSKDQILNFNENDWEFERSSGYAGERNINSTSSEYNKWIFENEFQLRKSMLRKYKDDFNFLNDFIDDLDFDICVDSMIIDFLNKKYFDKDNYLKI